MAYETDDKDVDILRVLGSNSRFSFREIAKKLKMHPNTVIERIKRMEKERIIEKYSVSVDYPKLGYKVSAILQVDVKGKTDTVMRRIASLNFVHNAYRTTGEYDGIAVVRCRDIEDLGRLVNDINGIEGVQRVNTKIILADFKECPDLCI